ncbi:hypothetical protein BD414DRAFT_203904 [Trametes punicea]|nr:hypothetical protein BD414DRAFT_203904 [Trametes punicea]
MARAVWLTDRRQTPVAVSVFDLCLLYLPPSPCRPPTSLCPPGSCPRSVLTRHSLSLSLSLTA